MELSSRISPEPWWEYWQFQIGFRLISSLRYGTISALDALRDALYKYTITTTNTNHDRNIRELLRR